MTDTLLPASRPLANYDGNYLTSLLCRRDYRRKPLDPRIELTISAELAAREQEKGLNAR